jgi:hypothetical protein
MGWRMTLQQLTDQACEDIRREAMSVWPDGWMIVDAGAGFGLGDHADARISQAVDVKLRPDITERNPICIPPAP